MRIGVILALCMILAVPVVVAMAASPDSSASAETSPSSDTSAAPSDTTSSAPATDTPATQAPSKNVAPLAPNATGAPSTTDGLKGGKADRFGFGGFGGGFGGRGAITITDIDGSKLTLKTDDGWTRTITVTADTTITKGGQTIKVGDLDVGDQIRFSQKRNDDGSYTITRIMVPTPVTGGEVTAVSGNSMTLKRRNGDAQTVVLNGSTIYKVGRADGSKSDVKVGSKVTVQGSVSGSTFTALTVNIQPTVVGGQVTAKTSSSITLKQRDGSSVVVHVSSGTTYRIRGDNTPALSDIAVGDMVIASGSPRSDGSIDADAVGSGRFKGGHDKNATPNSTTAPSSQPG